MAGFWIVMMGLGIAAILFIVLISIGVLLLLGAVAFFGMWLYRKQKGLPKRTPLLVMSIVCAVLSVLLIVVPASGMLSGENLSYVDTGLVTEENYKEISYDLHFTLNGVRYTPAAAPFTGYGELSPAVNIPDSKQMIYSVKNDAGVELYRFENYNYISAEGLEEAEEYYYDLTVPHEFTLNNGGSLEEVEFDIKAYNALYQMTLKDEHIEAEKPDDAYKFSFYALSPDGVCERYIHLTYDKKTGGVFYTPRYDSWGVYRITDPEIEQAVSQMVEEVLPEFE